MEVFGFQQSMTHCSEFVGCLSQNFPGCKEVLFTLVPVGSLDGCLAPIQQLPLSSRLKLLEEDVLFGTFVGWPTRWVWIQHQEEESMRVLLGKPSVAKQADALSRESCALAQLAGCKVDTPSYHPVSLVRAEFRQDVVLIFC